MLKYLPVSQENLKIVNLLSTPDETHLGLIYDWRNGYAVTIDTGWEGQERLLLFVWESCNAWSSAFGEDQWAESLWVRIGAQTNVGDVLGVCYLLVWSGISRWCLFQATGRSLTFSVPGAQGTLTTLLSAERATQQHTSISRGFWSVQMMTSWLRWLLNWQRRMLSWNSYFQTKKRMRQGCEGQGLQRYGDMVKSGSCEEGARQIETQAWTSGEQIWTSLGACLDCGTGEKGYSKFSRIASSKVKHSPSWHGESQAKRARTPAWLIKELLTKLKHKKEVYKRGQEGQVTPYNLWAFRNRVRKAKVLLELNWWERWKTTGRISRAKSAA